MKLHELRPARGAHTPKRRVGRGIAAGQGKTAGRGTKGQRSRAGGGLPAWFEGGQTPLHQRIPKLHGFRNAFKVEYEVVNVGAIARLVELGSLDAGDPPTGGAAKVRAPRAAAAPITVNQEILRAAGLVRTLSKPLKVLGQGEIAAPLFVVADAFSASARSKIEAAGGSVSILEVPKRPTKAIGVPTGQAVERPKDQPAAAADDVPSEAASGRPTDGTGAETVEALADAVVEAAPPSRAARVPKAAAAARPAAAAAKPAASAAKSPATDEAAPRKAAAPKSSAATKPAAATKAPAAKKPAAAKESTATAPAARPRKAAARAAAEASDGDA